MPKTIFKYDGRNKPHQLKTLISIAETQGIKVCSNFKVNVSSYPFFVFKTSDGEKEVYGSGDVDDGITFEKMVMKLCDVSTRELKLTDDYTAIINKESRVVEVGCQKIPFKKVDELHKLIHE
jgi:hypothetical protein